MEKINIGIREAKANLSKLIQDVQGGREIIITDRGAPVAYLGPVKKDKLSLKQRLSELEKAGIIEPPKKKIKNLPPPLHLPDQKAQVILQEDRDR
ncbi:MAG: type II toxin-antitoxin system prevent-host-death family antitoxin [Erysipelothrix sp.]|uniref:type II toxin-antitoxin system Phd/YefM family antitoxin n=1 Tax=Desulfitibacter alkalitolerans TaxID=264641 RepID=UPI000484A033|nr:type II toxin-antitoxin system prevent-host-death family antitoxin [Desulfitibacter alkalitolerans]MBS3987272.1 type II toxin-antitoxin system prevent-host-death family antitoxin [Erysipelothrix sp.]